MRYLLCGNNLVTGTGNGIYFWRLRFGIKMIKSLPDQWLFKFMASQSSAPIATPAFQSLHGWNWELFPIQSYFHEVPHPKHWGSWMLNLIHVPPLALVYQDPVNDLCLISSLRRDSLKFLMKYLSKCQTFSWCFIAIDRT